jgi:hypothetical protein
MRAEQARMKPTLAQAGGSDHVRQSLVLDIVEQGIRIDTHNMLEQCRGGDNAFGETEGPDEYQARLDFLSTQYANNFTHRTDILMLQEAPPTLDEAQRMFNNIQAKTSTPLAYFYETNSTGQGMMTIYNPTVAKPIAPQEMELNKRVQTTHFEIGGREVTFKNVHAKFEMGQPSEAKHIAAKQSMEALMQGKPRELIIRGGDHNGGQDFYPDLKFASTGGLPTSSAYDRRNRTVFTRDERTGVQKQYDGFAINDRAVALEAHYGSAGALILDRNNQVTLQHVEDIALPQPTAYRASNDGLIQLEFSTRQDASIFVSTLLAASITSDRKQSIPSGDNVILTFTLQEAQALAKSALILPEGLRELNKVTETKSKGGFVGGIVGGIRGVAGGIAGGIGEVAGGILNRPRGILKSQPVEQEQEDKQEHRASPAEYNEDGYLPEPIDYKCGKTGLIQLKFNNDNTANLFSNALYNLKIAHNQYGNGPKASRNSIITHLTHTLLNYHSNDKPFAYSHEPNVASTRLSHPRECEDQAI